VSVKVISDQLGHPSISFTLERHSHILSSIQDEAAAKVERMLMCLRSFQIVLMRASAYPAGASPARSAGLEFRIIRSEA
jgi:hypothetical protein